MRVFWGILIGAILFGGAAFGYSYFKDRDSLSISDSGFATPESFDHKAYFAQLKEGGFRTDTARDVDIDAVIAAMPQMMAVTYDEILNDADDNATVIRGLTVTSRDNADMGVKVAETRLWGFDSDGLAARLRGERLGDVIPVADRMEMSGISAFGLGTLYQPLVDASTKITMDLLENTIPNEEVRQAALQASSSTTIDTYDIGTDKVVVTKFTLHPYVLNLLEFPEPDETTEPAPAFAAEQFAQSIDDDSVIIDNEFDNEFDGDDEIEFEIDGDDSAEVFVHWLQTAAALNRAFSFDALAMYGSKFEMQTTDSFNQTSTMRFELPLIGYKGFDRGDTDVTTMRGLSYAMDMQVPVEPSTIDPFKTPGADDFVPMSIAGNVEQYLIRDLRLSNVYDLIARAVAPDKSMTDLLSLGLWTIENEKTTINGAPIYTMKKTVADLRGFHGIYPANISVEVDDAAYNLVAFAEMMRDMMAGSGLGADDLAEANQTIDGVIKVFEDNDFVDPAIDLKAAWNWDPETGGFDGNGLFALEDFISFTSTSDLDLPTYDALADNLTFEMTQEQQAAFQQAFREMFAFNGAEARLSDRGGVAKSFAMTVAFAELLPAGAGSNILVGAQPDDLRVMAATTMRLSAGQMAQAFPPAKDYILAAADFVSKGGTLIARYDPEVPVTAALLEAKAEDGTMNDPAAALKVFGFTLTHKGSGSKSE